MVAGARKVSIEMANWPEAAAIIVAIIVIGFVLLVQDIGRWPWER